jgi:rhodanese-related sulfurtransferase
MNLFGHRAKTENRAAPATISARELRERLDRGEPVLVLDVRQPFAYEQFPGVIPGSVRIPPAELPGRYGELPRDRLIVPYCT